MTGIQCVDFTSRIQQLHETAPLVLSFVGQAPETVIGQAIVVRLEQLGISSEVQALSWQGDVPEKSSGWLMRIAKNGNFVGRRVNLVAELSNPATPSAKPLRALLSMRGQAEALIATSRSERATPLRCPDFATGKIDIASTHGPVVTSCSAAASLQLTQHLEPGDVLHASGLRPQPEVIKQAQVRIRVTEGRIHLESTGIALADGRIGDTVTVRPAHSNQIVRGRVTEPGVVVLGKEDL